MSESGCNNLIVVSDLHCGCRLGLFPLHRVTLDEADGGGWTASSFQRKLFAYWTEFWHEWVPRITKHEKYDLCINGDLIDGVHHGSTTQISHNIEDQVDIACAVLEPILDKVKGKVFVVRGTSPHDGESGKDAANISKRLKTTCFKNGNRSAQELWIRTGDALVHCVHTIGTTSSSAHEASAINAEIISEYVEAARWGEEPPNYVVRSHRHRSMAVDIDAKKGNKLCYAAGLVTAGWQGKTPFLFRTAARTSQPQFGGLCIRQGDEEHYYRRLTFHLDRPEVENE
jgi:hypothetical protein